MCVGVYSEIATTPCSSLPSSLDLPEVDAVLPETLLGVAHRLGKGGHVVFVRGLQLPHARVHQAGRRHVEAEAGVTLHESAQHLVEFVPAFKF